MLALAASLVLLGCQPALYDADRATRPYPEELHRPETVDIQVFRDGTNLKIYNSTATTYRDFDVWINQRYVKRVAELPAGGRIKLSLWDFWDERGEVIDAGGLFRTYEPTPVRLVQIQPSENQPLIGLITIRAEDSP